MTHPLDQLAPFVDGTLDPAERVVVDEHLRSCDRCRAEVDAADAARTALRAMPEPTSPDLAERFSPGRIQRLTASPATSRAPWSKLAPVVAAAAVVALVALVVPRLGSGSSDGVVAADAGAEAGGDGAGPPARLELLDADLDEPALQEAATAFAAAYAQGRRVAADAGQEAAGAAVSAPAALSGQTRTAGPARAARAVACLKQAFPGFPGEVVRVQQATFEGTPAFIAYVIESPGADTPANAISIWVADAVDCSVLSFTSARL